MIRKCIHNNVCRLTARRFTESIDGGSYRGLALDEFSQSIGSRFLECYPNNIMLSRWSSRLRLFSLIAELEQIKPETLIVSYPISFPYLCDKQREMLKALILVYYLRFAAKRYTKRLIVDVGDLVFYKGGYAPWWEPVASMLLRLEKILLNDCATEVWAASETFAEYLGNTYGVRTKTVLNG